MPVAGGSLAAIPSYRHAMNATPASHSAESTTHTRNSPRAICNAMWRKSPVRSTRNPLLLALLDQSSSKTVQPVDLSHCQVPRRRDAD